MNMIEKDREGMVLRIERSSTFDGAGFRTVIFLKGCPLRCQWCSTPESHSFEIEKTDTNVYGQVMTVEQVMKEARKDSLFFFMSGGGITLSGGEMMAQPDFSRAILRNCRQEGYNTAIETSFFASWDVVKSILPYVNNAFVDLKIFDSELHKKYTGVDNELILNNLKATNELENDFKLVIRTPIIPSINDTPEELHAIGKFAAGLTHLDYVQLLPYHKLGVSTYEKLGLTYPLKDIDAPSAEQMAEYRSIVAEHVAKVI